MKRTIKLIGMSAGTILVGALLASAQGPRSHMNKRMYDPATETTFKGTVDAVTQGARGQMIGTHLTVKAGEETLEVMLGPSTFIASKGFSFAKGDALEVTGSKVTMGAMEFVIAREVVKDGKALTLRDKSGTPQWSGRGMGRGRTD